MSRLAARHGMDVRPLNQRSRVTGSIQVYAKRPADLRDWAHVLLAGSAFIDFAGIESTDTGAALLDALWDAADTGILNETSRKIVARLAFF